MSDWINCKIEDIIWDEFGDGIVPKQDGKLTKESEQPNIQTDGGPITGNRGWSDICFKQYNMDLGKSKFPSENHNALAETNEKRGICNILENVSSSDNGFAFLKNGNEREDDFLYYDWSDIINFDDIDKMIRNCDPIFGQKSKTDCQSWILSSSNDIFGSKDTSHSGLQCSSLVLNTIDGTSSQIAENSLPGYGRPAVDEQPSLGYSSFKSLSDSKQINEEMKLCEGQYSSRVEGKNQNQSNGIISYSDSSHMEQLLDRKQSQYFLTTPDAYSFQPSTKHENFASSESSIPMLKSYSTVHDNSSLDKDFFLHRVPTMIPAENNKSSPYEVSGHVCSALSHHTGNFPSNLVSAPGKKLMDVVEKQGVGTLKQAISVDKQENGCKQDLGSNRGRISLELASRTSNASAAYESSSMPSFCSNDISVKAISFMQLQDVIAPLNIRTKLCIRDSLYRLASSSEQRPDNSAYGTLRQKNHNGEHRSAETETNQIDRSIAHLLFHKQQEAAINPFTAAHFVS